MKRDRGRLHRKLVDKLYVEAMFLAEESRDYFTLQGDPERERLDPLARVGLACESLKVTTRLMHIIAWLITQRAVEAGEVQPSEALGEDHEPGESPRTDDALFATLPPEARLLIRASIDLHRRVERLDASQRRHLRSGSPVRLLQARLSRSF